MLHDLIRTTELELTSERSSRASSLRKLYVGDSKQLKLFQITLGDLTLDNRILELNFDCADNGDLFIVDQKRYFTMKKVDCKLYEELVEDLALTFNRRRETRILSLFVRDAYVKVPVCYAVPATFIGALKETISRIVRVVHCFKHEDSDKMIFLLKVMKRKGKEAEAVCQISFEENFSTGELKIRRIQVCHK